MTTNIQKWTVTIGGTSKHITSKNYQQTFDTWSEAADLFRSKCEELNIEGYSSLFEDEEYTTSMIGHDYVVSLERYK